MHGENAWERMREEEGRGHRPGGYRGRGHGRGPGFGGFPRMAGVADFGAWMGGPRSMRGPKVRRGDVRAAALALLAEEPRNGYQIIQEIGERSGGLWRPSPGSVYPALQQLEDEGLIVAETPEGGRKRFALTEEGRAYIVAHPDEVAAPWDDVARSVGAEAIELRTLFGQVVMAAVQVARVGNEAQVAQARQVLVETRRRLYRILASDDEADER